MRNFKLDIDITDLYLDLKEFHLKEYPIPYLTLFIEADDPDDACYTIIQRLIQDVLRRDTSIITRIFCRSIRKLIRFDKIQSL